MTSRGPVLAADVGGTNTRLALYDLVDGRLSRLDRRDYENREAASLGQLILDFLAGRMPRLACLAVAGPTDGRSVRMTNLAWSVEAADLRRQLGMQAVELINDFVAVGHGLAALDGEGVETLQAGQPLPASPRVALGAGTGLGVVQCLPVDNDWWVAASEGGHMGFAPQDARQDALLAYLRRIHGRVSLERILSGPGLESLYGFCWTEAGGAGSPPMPPAARVSGDALAGTDPLAGEAVGLFCRILGQAAGDLALMAQARGGVYLAGGIPPRLRAFLSAGGLLAGFNAKGRFSDWMTRVPVHLVIDDEVGLKGAAMRAIQLQATVAE